MRNYNLENFDWGWMEYENVDINNWSHKSRIINEIFEQQLYEKFCEVKEGDIVVDIGASIGPFTYSILNKKPKQVFCIEPSPKEHDTLIKNVSGDNVKIIKKGITKNDGDIICTDVFGGVEEELIGISFNTFLVENNIDKINFLKTDCEGGEYDIFNIENLCWLKNNLKFAVGEWHLSTPELKQKFREFRDVFLRVFPNHEVFSVDGVNIKWDLWNENFINYYNEVIISLNNK
jgi:FkbM family methyltransferase